RGATRARTSQGVRRTAMRFELWTTTPSSTRRPRAEAVDLPASSARWTSDSSIVSLDRCCVDLSVDLSHVGPKNPASVSSAVTYGNLLSFRRLQRWWVDPNSGWKQ